MESALDPAIGVVDEIGMIPTSGPQGHLERIEREVGPQ